MPVSAVDGVQLDLLADLLLGYLPPSPPLYPDGELTDEPEQVMIAELIREAALEGVRDELPHSLAVLVEEMGPREGRPDLIDVHATIFIERQSQKAIVLGSRGERMKQVGTQAPPADRGTPGLTHLPRSARQGRQGLAARSSPAAAPRLLVPPTGHFSVLLVRRAGTSPRCWCAERALLRAAGAPSGHSSVLLVRRAGTPPCCWCAEMPGRCRSDAVDYPVGVVRRTWSARSASFGHGGMPGRRRTADMAVASGP